MTSEFASQEAVSTNEFSELHYEEIIGTDNEWSDEDNAILIKFCENNVDLNEQSRSSDIYIEKLVELSLQLHNKYKVEELRVKLDQHLIPDGERDETVEEWSTEDEERLKSFVGEHPSISKNDERGKKTKEILLYTLSEIFQFRYSVEDLQLKLLDIAGKWRSDDVDTVIAYYDKNSFLWDSSLIDYSNKIKKNIAMEELSRQINFRKTGPEIDAKFEGLKSTFANCSKKGTTGKEGKSMKPWPYYQCMMFLKKSTIQRPSFTNVVSQNLELDDECMDDECFQKPSSPVIPEVSDCISASDSGSSQWSNSSSNVPSLVGTKRRHVKYGETMDEKLKKEIMTCLDTKPTGADSFGSNVAESLKPFTPVNQEFVKARIQDVLAKSLECQEQKKSIPKFYSEN